MPLIRYWMGDITFLMDSRSCDCGRTMRRIGRIKGRADDMIIVNGVNVFPQAVELAVLGEEWASPHYQIVLWREGSLDRMEVVVESSKRLGEKERAVLAERLREILRDALLVNPRVRIADPGTLPRTDGGKARRVVDRRVDVVLEIIIAGLLLVAAAFAYSLAPEGWRTW